MPPPDPPTPPSPPAPLAPPPQPADPQAIYRPLCGGIRIENPTIGETGTLGFFARDGGRVFLVSCEHVLEDCHLGVPPGIYQPDGVAANLISDGPPRYGVADCAAVELLPGVAWVNDCLNLGPLGPAIPLVDGMLVRKCGAVTGVTDGVVAAYGTDLLIAPAPGAPPGSLITDAGDSGALWVEAGTNRPVAIDRGARIVGGRTWAVVVPIDAVLNQLQLIYPP